MDARSSLRLALLGLSALAMQSASAQDPGRARDLLMQTMVRETSRHVSAVIMQRMVDEPSRMQQIQVTISRDGQMRQTVLQPLSLQGVETVDNGKIARTFLPDRRMVIEMPSPRLTPCDAHSRIQLAEKNYRLRSADGPSIAGRASVLVTASPKNRDLAVRRYFIDPTTGYLLKLETQEGGKTTVAFETRFVTFPTALPKDAFTFSQITGNVKVVVRKPEEYRDPKASAKLDFEPLMPTRLPYGFVVEDVHLVNPERGSMLGVRITDGLVKGTVYQWAGSESNRMRMDMPNASYIDAGKLRMMVVADVPQKARERILQVFASAKPATNLGLFSSLAGVDTAEAFHRLEAEVRFVASVQGDCVVVRHVLPIGVFLHPIAEVPALLLPAVQLPGFECVTPGEPWRFSRVN